MSDLFSPRFAPPPPAPLPPSPPAPPPAPPLPPQKYVNRATNALVRFAQPFIGASRLPSSRPHRSDGLEGNMTPPPLPRSSSPITSQTATHRTGIRIAALDISSQRTHAVLAGREILKTIRVSGANCAEEFNLRASIIAYSSTHNPPGGASPLKHKDDLAANDVKWSHGHYSSTIATACPNGRIILYDINRAGVELARLHEHNRQVHKLAFNPHQGYFLLSGSQDTTMRLWDLRALAGGRSVMTFRSLRKYRGNAEGVRDVKWSPTNGTEFACATDAGTLQRWDYRNDIAPLQKVNAHKRNCLSIDWHPDGKHLVSAGVDKMVQVWDFSSSERRQNSPWSFRAPHAVTKVCWRPAGWQARSHGSGGWESTQLVTSYDSSDPRIHLWSLKNPLVPFREIDRYNTPPTDMLWHSENLLWTVGSAGMFTQTDIHFAPKIRDRRQLQPFDVAPDGAVSFHVQTRFRPREPALDGDSRAIAIGGAGREKGSGGEKLSGSRSSAENDAASSLLSSSFGRRHGRTSSNKSSKSAENTPPSGMNSVVVTHLNDVLRKRQTTDHLQLSAYGHSLTAFRPVIFQYLATHLRVSKASRELKSFADVDRLRRAMEHNTKHARLAGLYRLSHTWSIVAHVAVTDLISRATLRKDARLKVNGEASKRLTEQAKPPVWSVTQQQAVNDTVKLDQGKAYGVASDSATPRARPVQDISEGSRANPSFPQLTRDPLALPPSVHSDSFRSDSSRLNRSSSYGSDADPGSAYTSTSWHNSGIDIVDRRRALDTRPGQARPPLRLDLPGDQSFDGSKLQRFDSNDSFPMFSASTDERQSLPNSLEGADGPTADADLDARPTDDLRKSSVYEGPNPRAEQKDFAPSNLDVKPTSSYSTALSEMPSPYDEQMEASVTVVPDDGSPKGRSPIDSQATSLALDLLPQASTNSSVHGSAGSRLSFITADLAPTATIDPGSRYAWSTAPILAHTIDFHLRHLTDNLTPAMLLLQLQPLVVPDTLHPLLVSSLFQTYHQQLMALGLVVQAAHLRRLCAPHYPAVYEAGKENVAVVFRCQGCGGRPSTVTTPNVQRTSWLCEKCNQLQAPCPICRLRRGRGRWAWCQGCGHGGHAACLEPWWSKSESEGGCAVEGCLHDCTRGARRDSRQRGRERRLVHKSRGSVRRDDWIAGESCAVQRVRGGLLAGGGAGGGKRVKLLTPSEQGHV